MTATLVALALSLTAPPDLTGIWFFADFRELSTESLNDKPSGWALLVVIRGDRFALKFYSDGDPLLTGRLKFDRAHPSHFDLVLDAAALPNYGPPIPVPFGPRPGVFAKVNDEFRCSLGRFCDSVRPASVDQKRRDVLHATLRRAPAGVVNLPQQFVATVTDAAGKPVVGAYLADWSNFGGVETLRAAATAKTPANMTIMPEMPTGYRTDAAGQVTCQPLSFQSGVLIAYDPARHHIAAVPISPADLMAGKFTMRLSAGREVVVPLRCPELASVADSVGGSLYQGDRRLAYILQRPGTSELRFLAAPGDYRLELRSRRIVDETFMLTVPPGEGTFQAESAVVWLK